MIVCEGRSDNIYLKYAIRKLDTDYPMLWRNTDEKTVVSFFNYNNSVQHIMGLTGGAGTLQKLINSFDDKIKRYNHRPLWCPNIILIDNDTALTELKGTLKKRFNVEIELTYTRLFYRLTHNLYLIKTPELGKVGTSCIEDCFDNATKAIKLEGKSFNPKKILNPDTEYGKIPFAEKVVVPHAGDIAWDGFRPLLDRISAVIANYQPPACGAANRVRGGRQSG